MKKILLVDDEKDVLEFMGSILQRNNYEIFPTTKGEEAMGLAKKVAPDAIILDVIMPDKDGTEVAMELGQDPATKDIPVIFLTGMLSPEQEMPGRKTNSHHYAIAKPVTTEELLQVIQNALAAK